MAPTPEHETKVRVKFATERQFLVEQNVFDADETVTRPEIREAVEDLTHEEQQVLKSRLRRNLKRVEELMDGDPETFEEPRVTVEDLVAGVTLADEH